MRFRKVDGKKNSHIDIMENGMFITQNWHCCYFVCTEGGGLTQMSPSLFFVFLKKIQLQAVFVFYLFLELHYSLAQSLLLAS